MIKAAIDVFFALLLFAISKAKMIKNGSRGCHPIERMILNTKTIGFLIITPRDKYRVFGNFGKKVLGPVHFSTSTTITV